MLILASGSPRRRSLLAQVGIPYMVNPSSYKEDAPARKDPEKFVIAQALGKAKDVASRYPDRWVLGADTVVVFDGEILGKPKNEKDAISMLKGLSNHKHSVFTGLALVKDDTVYTKAVETKVWFRKLKEREIVEYVCSGEPMDKAGSYGIQGKAAIFIDKINGSYTNVVGLPVSQVYTMLQKAKVME